MSALLLFQLRRVGRNRQFLLFTVLLPALFTIFFTKIFGGQARTAGDYQDVAAGVMVSMMAYGGLGAALGATIRMSFDRASGWLRQLRISPVPLAHVFAVDVVVGALLTLPGLVVVALAGRFVSGVDLPVPTWLALRRGALGRVGGLRRARATPGAVPRGEGRRRRHGRGGRRARHPGRTLGTGRRLPPLTAGAGAGACRRTGTQQMGRDVAAGLAPDLTAVLALCGFTAVFAVLAVLVAARRPLHAVSG